MHTGLNYTANSNAAGCPRRAHVWLVCLGLGVLTLAAYGQVVRFEFVNWDDYAAIMENPRVAGGLTRDNVLWALKIHGPLQWHPLAYWCHQLNCQLFGWKAGPHHVVNVLLHVTAALALLGAFWRLTGNFWPSALVAALFALHPLSVESVAWISHLRDPLSTIFWALVMWAYAGYARRGGARRYLMVLFLFAVGLMAKPTLCTLPCVLLLLDYWPLRRLRVGVGRQDQALRGEDRASTPHLGWLLLEKAPLLALSGVSAWLSYLSQHSILAIVTLESIPLGSRLANTAQAYVLHLVHLLWPINLAPVYPFPDSFHAPWVAAAVALLAALTVAAVYFGRHRGYLLVGWLWFLGTLAPVIGLVKMGAGTSLTDHHAYVPLLGIYAALAWTLAECVQHRPRWRLAVSGAAAVVLLGLTVVTWRQTAIWQNGQSLWEYTLAVTKNNSIAHNNLGCVLRDLGKTAEATEHYRQAVQIDPRNAMACNNLGYCLAEQGNLDEAIHYYQRALEAYPILSPAHANWGNALAAQGKFDEAIWHFEQGLRVDPMNVAIHNDWGNMLFEQDKLDEAIGHYQEVLRIYPANAYAYRFWAAALAAQGQLEDAVQKLQESLRLRPNDAPAHLNLSITLARQGQWDQAMEHFREAMALNPSCDFSDRNVAAARFAPAKLDEVIASQLGQLLVREGRHSEAEPYLREALKFEATNAVVRAFLATTLHQQGKTDEALRQFEECVRLDPDRPEPLHNIAWIRATHPDVKFRNGSEAVRVAERACQLTDRKNPFFLDCLAAAYAETGRWTDAVSTAREAASVATKEGLTGLAAQIERRVALYQAKRPFRQPPGSA